MENLEAFQTLLEIVSLILTISTKSPQTKASAKEKSKKLITEKNKQIRSLEIMVNTALKRPGFYAENYNHQGDLEMTSEQRKIEIDQGNYNEKIQGDYYEQSGNFGIGHMSGGEIQDGAKVAGVINEAEEQDLASAAAEIQNLLKQLEQTYPTNTTTEQMLAATKAIEQIENNPTWKQKAIAALKQGSLNVIATHPVGKFIVGAIEGWQKQQVK